MSEERANGEWPMGKIDEVLGATPGGRGAYLSVVHNAQTGQYFVPIVPEVDAIRAQAPRDRNRTPRTMAIIDSGVLHEHPVIKANLVDSVDFTGEGPEDLNGHGTAVALIALSIGGAGIYNVKALDAEGRGDMDSLVKAIEWSVAHHAFNITLSAGIFYKKWGLLECKGDCPLCRAALVAASAGVRVFAAAGNEAGKTYCPAKAALTHPDIGVFAVTTTDLNGHLLGKGTVEFDRPQTFFRPPAG